MPAVATIRRMAQSDLPAARRLQHSERWNQTTGDWNLFLETNPDGCFVAVADEAVVGTITSIRHGNSACWISMVLVESNWRGQGIATSLLERTIRANKEACQCLRLDATPAGRPVYERLGFSVDYEIQRWMADPALSPKEVPPACVALNRSDFATLLPFDREVFGADRENLLSYLISAFPASAWKIDRRGSAPSYVLGRRGEHYNYIGPVVASSEAEAQDLISAALVQVGHQASAIDVVSPSDSLTRFLLGSGFEFQRPFTRMSYGGVVSERPEMVTAIAGPEFG